MEALPLLPALPDSLIELRVTQRPQNIAETVAAKPGHRAEETERSEPRGAALMKLRISRPALVKEKHFRLRPVATLMP